MGGPRALDQIGRACQRFFLQPTVLRLRLACINQPARRSDLATLISARGLRPDIVIRFGHGPVLPYSVLRPVVPA